MRTTFENLPPFRFWIGCILMAAISIFIEKRAAIASGGVAGVGIALAHWTAIPVSFWVLVLKTALLGLAFWHGGKRLTIWTGVAIVTTAISMWLFELVPVSFTWHPTVAFVLITVFAYAPLTLILHSGYSAGGYATFAQVLLERARVPVGISIGAANGVTLLLMFLAFGAVSGLFSLLAILASGPMAQAWWSIWRYTLGEPGRANASNGR